MAWDDSGYVFTRKDGQPINPNYATTGFRKPTEPAGLPPVRSLDLRHGAVSPAHEASADLKTLQDLRRLSAAQPLRLRPVPGGAETSPAGWRCCRDEEVVASASLS
jgi:hypothetical protein